MKASKTNEGKPEPFSLKENYLRHKFDLFTAYRTHFLIFVLSAVLDAASTTHFMRRTGPGNESNFYVRTLSETYGIKAGPLLGKFYQLFALWGFSILAPRLTRFVCLIVIAINFAAAIVNYASFG
ncbi:MAG: hypothetical protein O2960_14435 [Verrucomicrobia bacterium]|nr:hypothetical protein [Verrucomicrobiota bacterium]